MKITLVVTNPMGKNLVFFTDSLHALSLVEAVNKAKTALLDNIFVVNGTYGEYLRAIPNSSEKDNLDSLSVTASDILAFTNHTRHFKSTDAISLYVAQYIASVIESDPNPDDAKLPFSGNLSKNDRKYLFEYVVEPKHNIRFLAARLRGLIIEWAKYVDISSIPEILGTLYHRSYVPPHAHPKPNERGDQIVVEFYTLAQKWLK